MDYNRLKQEIRDKQKEIELNTKKLDEQEDFLADLTIVFVILLLSALLGAFIGL